MSLWAETEKGTPWGVWSSEPETNTPGEVAALTAEGGWGHEWDELILRFPYLRWVVA